MRNVLVELNTAISNALLDENDIEFININYSPYGEESIVVCSKCYDDVRKAFKNLDYDAGYGSQELFGVVKFNNGTWLERDEYDGSEWWTHVYPPEMPEKLK